MQVQPKERYLFSVKIKRDAFGVSLKHTLNKPTEPTNACSDVALSHVVQCICIRRCSCRSILAFAHVVESLSIRAGNRLFKSQHTSRQNSVLYLGFSSRVLSEIVHGLSSFCFLLALDVLKTNIKQVSFTCVNLSYRWRQVCVGQNRDLHLQ